MNIVELILKLLGGDTLKQLSAFTGESPDLVQKALGAIVPTLLSGIGGAAAKPNGAEKLFNSLRSIDDSLSDNLGSVIAKGGADELAKKGTNILGDLLGSGGLTALIGQYGFGLKTVANDRSFRTQRAQQASQIWRT